MFIKKLGLGLLFILIGITSFFVIKMTIKSPEVLTQKASVTPALLSISTKKCPEGFILVPGDKTYGTGDFCVMKYDAKCADTSDLSVGLEPSHHSSCSGESGNDYYGTYKNNGQGCSCTGERQIVSTKSGFPVAYIPLNDGSANDAVSYCSEKGWHVMSNNEWMTIARNVEEVPANWCNKDGGDCGNAPGSIGKILANGHNDDNNEASAGADTNSALVAGSDDQPCFGTTIDGSNICGGKGSQKRTLTLSNGESIWDLAGNVWQWVNATIERKDQPKSISNGVTDKGWIWSDFTPGALNSVITDSGQVPSLGYDAFRPTNPNWNSNNGVGRIYHFSSLGQDTDTSLYAFIRGGNWRHGYDSGAFTIHLSPQANKTGINDVGFRCTAPAQ